MYAIRLSGDPVWFTNGIEDLFNTEEEAVQAIIKESEEIEKDIKLGYLEDFDFDEYRIVEVI
jgi:hypothetical protein